MKHGHIIYIFASKDRNEVFLGKNGSATGNSCRGGGGVHDSHSHPVHPCLAVGPVDIVPINTHVDVDAVVGSDHGGGYLNKLLPGSSCQTAVGSCVDEELVLVAGLHALALQVDGEASVVAAEDVLQAILGEDHLATNSAGGCTSSSLSGAPTGGGRGLKDGLRVLDSREGERPDVAGYHVAGVSGSIVGGVASVRVDPVLGIDDGLLVVHMRHHIGIPEGLGRRQGRGNQRQQQQPGWKKG